MRDQFVIAKLFDIYITVNDKNTDLANVYRILFAYEKLSKEPP